MKDKKQHWRELEEKEYANLEKIRDIELQISALSRPITRDIPDVKEAIQRKEQHRSMLKEDIRAIRTEKSKLEVEIHEEEFAALEALVRDKLEKGERLTISDCKGAMEITYKPCHVASAIKNVIAPGDTVSWFTSILKETSYFRGFSRMTGINVEVAKEKFSIGFGKTGLNLTMLKDRYNKLISEYREKLARQEEYQRKRDERLGARQGMADMLGIEPSYLITKGDKEKGFTFIIKADLTATDLVKVFSVLEEMGAIPQDMYNDELKG